MIVLMIERASGSGLQMPRHSAKCRICLKYIYTRTCILIEDRSGTAYQGKTRQSHSKLQILITVFVAISRRNGIAIATTTKMKYF